MNASGRPNTCKSNGISVLGWNESGARVRNAYATYPLQEDSPEKFGLIFHGIIEWHRLMIKVTAVRDGHAYD
jgi:hypothetical protein